MKDKLIKLFVGKNMPHLARVAATFVGSLFLMTPLFSPEATALDPGVGSTITELHAPSSEQVRDGLTVGEMVGTVLGLMAIWLSAFVSWLRARNLSWLANLLGPIFGRSLPSFGRRLLVILAGLLARATAQPELAPDVLAQMPLANILATLGLIALANWSSATEDAQRNPVPTLRAEPVNPLDER